MLIQLSIENFLSFKEKVTFSMVKGLQRSFPEHIIQNNIPNDIKLLKAALMYGANASGKSNFVKALDFFQELVVKGIEKDKKIPVKPFLLDKEFTSKPSEFTIEFSNKGKNYSYGISFDSEKIQQEWLYEILKTTEKMLFERSSERGKTQVQFGSWISSLKKDEREFLEFIAKGTRPNQPFLTECIERNVDYFNDVYYWVKNSLVIIFPSTKLNLANFLYDDDKTKYVKKIINYLDNFDTGVVDYSLIETSIKDLLPEELISKLEKDLDFETTATLMEENSNKRFFIRKDETSNKLIANLLVLKHRSSDSNSKSISIDPDFESDGTIRLIDLIPILISTSEKENVYIIDEFDRSIHPNISYQFMEWFLQKSEEDTQLIVTTHEENLLDLELLRRDEIWFVEKDYYGCSHLYSLEEYQPRYDKDIRKGYLQGRFGAIPILREPKICK